MAQKISDLFKGNIPATFLDSMRSLPNGGGLFSPLGGITENPPITTTPAPRIFTPRTMRGSSITTPIPTSTAPVPKPVRSKYINPETGQYFATPEEYGNYVASRIPVSKGTGDVTKYAGDAMTKPDQSVENLTNTARDLNNARNDIATGTTDPFKIGKDSGIAYSPEQLATIEKAYAGIYDPAINDVFTRIKQKEKLDEELAKAKTEESKIKVMKEMAVFNTNENIRQWNSTTGSKKTGSNDRFTETQSANGASNAGMSFDDFENLDDDVKNFYINPPMSLDENTNKNVPKYKVFENLLNEIASGTKTSDEVVELITGSETLPATVKQFFIAKIPNITPAEKQKHWYNIFTNWMN